MKKLTNAKINILTQAIKIFALDGMEGLSMRHLAGQIGVTQSSLYNHFKDKNDLLFNCYLFANQNLGQKRLELNLETDIYSRLKQLIKFQFENSVLIVFVLKYYFSNRQYFAQLPEKTLPPKAILHVQEFIEYGIKTQVFDPNKINDAKVIAHSINGYLLEYFPHLPIENELDLIVEEIADFVYRGLTK